MKKFDRWFLSNNKGMSGSLYGESSLVVNSLGTSPITIVSTTVIYSRHFKLARGQAFGIWYQAGNGSGTANMKIQLEQSYKLPTTEGASDASWIIGSGVSDIETNLNDTTAHLKSISPVPMKWARLKITGLGGNPADATLTAYIFLQGLS